MNRQVVFRFHYTNPTEDQERVLVMLERFLGMNREEVIACGIGWFLSIQGLYYPSVEFGGEFYNDFRYDFQNTMASIVESLEDQFRSSNQMPASEYELLPIDSYGMAKALLDYFENSFQTSMEAVKGIKTSLVNMGFEEESIINGAGGTRTTIHPSQSVVDVSVVL